jgi:hypothetical protein
MPLDIGQSAVWPGVLGVESCVGTVSHGVSPSVFVLTTIPQLAAPAERGDLVITDGLGAIRFRDCKVDSVSGTAGPQGQTWVLSILDRRWKWRGYRISGRYNQLDSRGKLVPWTIRSPEELAELCLEAMGERNYLIRLPKGLTSAAGKNVERFLRPGENFPQSLANPPVNWDTVPPAEALARLADQYGCRVVWQPLTDRVLVVPLGEGLPLPEGLCEVIAPSLDVPETPEAVAVAGAPVPVQMRFPLEPVGEEWDGSLVPIDDLSYAPEATPAAQTTTVTYTGSGDPTQIIVTLVVNPGPSELAAEFSATPPTVAAKLPVLVSRINGHPEISKYVVASGTSTVLTLTGKEVGKTFTVVPEAVPLPAGDTWLAAVTQVAVPPGRKTWGGCMPPNFARVRATDRLQYSEAVALARKSVFKYYRVRFADPKTGKPPLKVPWYGDLVRRQQLVLQPNKVEEVEPAPREKGGVDKDALPGDPRTDPQSAAVLGGILPDFYSGYARAKPASVTGSVSRWIGTVQWVPGKGFNTEADEKVRVPFSVDPVEQVVVFSDWVFRLGLPGSLNAMVEKPALILETSVLVTDAKTGELVRWEEKLHLGGGGPTEWAVREDVQVSVVGRYGPAATVLEAAAAVLGGYGGGTAPTGYEFKDLEDAKARASYYLRGMAARYRLEGGETRQYIGIIPIDPDGFRQQVTYSVGPGGATTVASTNSEHSDVIPNYPERRRRENLSPDKSAAAANLAEQKALDRRLPKAPGTST